MCGAGQGQASEKASECIAQAPARDNQSGDEQTLVTTSVPIRVGTWMCELVVWCQWNHRGDLTTTNISTTLELSIDDFVEIMRRYPTVKALGVEHAPSIVDWLNREYACDLFD